LSASGYTAWFSGLGERSDAEGLTSAPQPIVTIDLRPPLPPVASLITRDPFAGNPALAASAVNQAGTAHRNRSSAGATAAAGPDPSDGSSSVVVPDIEVRSGPAATTLTLVLRATIVGPEPVAYVANGTQMDIVRVGDILGVRRVTRIDLRGIAFADGTRLDLPGAFVPTPAPAHPSDDRDRITLETLRRLLLAPRTPTTATTPSIASTAAPEPSASYPTPAPLQTVDRQGLPVGVNPTENPAEPTAYPYPYPYAPRVPH
jgi:hypothetical protein